MPLCSLEHRRRVAQVALPPSAVLGGGWASHGRLAIQPLLHNPKLCVWRKSHHTRMARHLAVRVSRASRIKGRRQ